MKNPIYLLSTLLACAETFASPFSLNPIDYHRDQIVRADVAVIGGGSSGTYTSVRLKEMGYSVVVVEKKDRLGGHAQTYTDPVNGFTIDFGVIVFGKTSIVDRYFKRFRVPLVPFNAGSGTTEFVNPTTGNLVQGFTSPNSTALAAALQVYSAQLAKYSSIQSGFNLTYPVAEELLEPFGSFLTKHKLEALFPLIYSTNQGYVPILEIATLYMLKYLNPTQVKSIFQGFQTTKNHDIAALYNAAVNYLGSRNVLLSSEILAMNRTGDKVSILVKTPAGSKLVISKKLVSAIPPTLGHLKAYDLSNRETQLFGQFVANGYVTSILNNTGLRAGASLNSVDPSRPFNVPTMPNPYGFSVNAGTNLTQIYFASPRPQPDADAKAGIIAALKRFQKAQGIKRRGGDFLAFSNHAPFNLMVSTKAIRAGFYKKLNALNGQANTYWNGAAFQSQDSTVIWDYTEHVVLPRILQGLKSIYSQTSI